MRSRWLLLLVVLHAAPGDTDELGGSREAEFPEVPIEHFAVVSKLWSPAELRTDPSWKSFLDDVDDIQELAHRHSTEHEAQAEQWLRELIETYPQFRVLTHFHLGVLLLRYRKQARAAQAVLEEILKEKGWGRHGSAVHNNVGVALEVQGQAEEALASYITAAELLDPDCFPFPECAEEHAVIFYNAARLLPTGAAARALRLAARLAAAPDRDFFAALAARAAGGARARPLLLSAMAHPAFRFPPPRDLLEPGDEGALREARFRAIFRTRFWHPEAESASGPGSSLAATGGVRALLPALLETLQVTSLLDVGCGDVHWVRHAALGRVDYAGVDIVPELAARNAAAMRGAAGAPGAPRSARFAQADAVRAFPRALCGIPTAGAGAGAGEDQDGGFQDEGEGEGGEINGSQGEGGGCELVLVKEVLIHLTVRDVLALLRNLDRAARDARDAGVARPPSRPRVLLVVLGRASRRRAAGVTARARGRRPRFLLATHSPGVRANTDRAQSFFALPGGGWRDLNLRLPPFSLPSPAREFSETFGFALWALPFEGGFGAGGGAPAEGVGAAG